MVRRYRLKCFLPMATNLPKKSSWSKVVPRKTVIKPAREEVCECFQLSGKRMGQVDTRKFQLFLQGSLTHSRLHLLVSTSCLAIWLICKVKRRISLCSCFFAHPHTTTMVTLKTSDQSVQSTVFTRTDLVEQNRGMAITCVGPGPHLVLSGKTGSLPNFPSDKDPTHSPFKKMKLLTQNPPLVWCW